MIPVVVAAGFVKRDEIAETFWGPELAGALDWQIVTIPASRMLSPGNKLSLNVASSLAISTSPGAALATDRTRLRRLELSARSGDSTQAPSKQSF